MRLIRIYMLIALLAVAVAAVGCGLREDTLQCRDFCDKARACDPAMTDAEWDDCLLACQETGHTQEAVDCVLSRGCETGRFDELVSSCYLNPFAPEPEE